MVEPMGIAGPAWATVISQGVSGVLCVLYMKRKYDILRLKKEDLMPDRRCIGRLLYIGIPMGLQYSITAIGSLVLQSAVNVLGSTYVASSATAIKISMFFTCPFDALGSTAATYAGQNIGAGKLDRISKGLRDAIIIGAVYSAVALIVMLLFGKNLAYIFLEEPSELLMRNTSMYLTCNAIFYMGLCLVNTIRFLIQGMGYSVLSIAAGVFEMIARGFAGLVLVPKYGYIAACLASPLAWVLADIFLILAYIVIMKRLKNESFSLQKRVKTISAAAR